MKPYEIMFITIPQDDAFDTIRDLIKSFIESHEGKVDNVDEWGKRHLQFELEGYSDGIYCLIQFRAASEAVKKLNNKLLQLANESDPSLLRFMIIRKGE